MALARARRDSGMNYWPGFVDALSTLILGFIFLVTVFAVVQFYLTQEMRRKRPALNRLDAQITAHGLLSLEKTGTLSLEEQLNALRSSLATSEGERDRYKGLYEGIGGGAADAQGKAAELSGQLDSEKRLTARALAQVEVLNQQIAALRRQLSALESALDASEKRTRRRKPHRRSGATVERGAGPARAGAVALPFRLLERLRAILGNRPDIRIVGDRFVFQSEVFDTGKPRSTSPKAGPSSTRSQARCSSSRRRYRARSPGCCASMGIPTYGRSTARSSRTTGSSPSGARSRSCSTSSARACRRNGWWPRASANSSPSMPTRPRKPSAATAASSSS